MRKFLVKFFILLEIVSFAQQASAKRVAPPEVSSVRIGEVEYSAPASYGEVTYIEAHDIASGKLLGKYKIYETR